MSTKKISILLATIFGMGMILCSIASAGDNETRDIYFEYKAKGKGYELNDDNRYDEDGVYIESKYKFPKGVIFYSWVDRTSNSSNVDSAYYDADNETWKSETSGCAMETDQGYIINLRGTIYNTEDDVEINQHGLARATLKENTDGILKSGKVKSIGANYKACESGGEDEDWDLKLRGELKVKGKLIAWEDLPEDVKEIFEPTDK